MARLSYIVMVIGISLMCTFAQEKYDDKYDDIDAKAILEDSKQRNEWYNCFMRTEPCKTPEAQFFEEVLAESFHTQCQKCTDKQKELQKTFIEWYTKNEPEKWQVLVANLEQQFKN